jgi:hypothetical protein
MNRSWWLAAAFAACPAFGQDLPKDIDRDFARMIWACGQLSESFAMHKMLGVRGEKFDPWCVSLGKTIGRINEDGTPK